MYQFLDLQRWPDEWDIEDPRTSLISRMSAGFDRSIKSIETIIERVSSAYFSTYDVPIPPLKPLSTAPKNGPITKPFTKHDKDYR